MPAESDIPNNGMGRSFISRQVITRSNGRRSRIFAAWTAREIEVRQNGRNLERSLRQVRMGIVLGF